jgi:RecA-family ATPase
MAETVTALKAAIEAAPEIAPPRRHTPIDECDCARWLGVTPAPLVPVVDDLLFASTASLLVAPGGAGKTLLQQMLITAIVSGLPFLGRETAGGNAAGIFCEDIEGILHARQLRIGAELNVDEEVLVGRAYIGSYAGLDCCMWQDGRPTEWALALERQLARIPELRCVAIDNAALVYGDEWNDPPAVTRFMAWLNGLADRLKVAIVLSTHISKSHDGTALRAVSGTTAWVNAARAVLELTPETDGKSPMLKLVKSNYTKPEQTIELGWRNGVLLQAAAPDQFALRFQRQAIERLILERVAQAWAQDYPLSAIPQTADRYLPRALAAASKFSIDDIKTVMLSLLDTSQLKRGQRTTRTPAGLRVAE